MQILYSMGRKISADTTKLPMQNELLIFAGKFSKNYKIFSGGDYFSDNKKYYIRYLDGKRGSPNGMPHGTNTFARISNETGIIELDKIALINNKNITENFVFYLILWCIERLNVQSETEADIKALKIYLEMSLPTKDVKIGWLEQFKLTPNVFNKKRYENIDAFLSCKIVSPIKNNPFKNKKGESNV